MAPQPSVNSKGVIVPRTADELADPRQCVPLLESNKLPLPLLAAGWAMSEPCRVTCSDSPSPPIGDFVPSLPCRQGAARTQDPHPGDEVPLLSPAPHPQLPQHLSKSLPQNQLL